MGVFDMVISQKEKMKLLSVPLIGRFGNLLFIYAHARAWAEQNGYELCLPTWIGEKVFTIPQAVRPEGRTPDFVWSERMYQDQDSIIYTRKQVREWFKIRPEVLEQLRPVYPVEVLLDVREGADYLGAGLVSLGVECYADAAIKRGYSPSQTEWELDTHPTRLPYFTGDATAAGLGTTWVSIPAFYRMMTAKVHFRANSTFSWWAATLGNAKVYAPVIRGMRGGVPNQYCDNWVEGNWPVMADNAPNTDLHLAEDSIPA